MVTGAILAPAKIHDRIPLGSLRPFHGRTSGRHELALDSALGAAHPALPFGRGCAVENGCLVYIVLARVCSGAGRSMHSQAR